MDSYLRRTLVGLGVLTFGIALGASLPAEPSPAGAQAPDTAVPAAQAAATPAAPGPANLRLQLSAEILQSMADTAVENIATVREAVMGTLIRGTAHTHGKLSLQLQPGSDRGVLDMRLTGYIDAPDLVGTQRWVTIYSSSRTKVDAFKRIYLDRDGLHPGQMQARCDTNTQYHDIVANRRLIEMFAWRRLDRVRGQAEAIAKSRTEDRVGKQFDEQASQQLVKANATFRERLLGPANERGLMPETIEVRSDVGRLQITATKREADQSGPAGGPPAIAADDDLALWLHESFVNNLCETALGGKEVEDRDLLSFVKLLTGEQPRALWVHDNTPRWSIRMLAKKPIEVSLADNKLRVVWRCERATRGDEQLDEQFAVGAWYELQTTSEGPQFVRQGNLKFQFASATGSSGSRAEFQDFLLRKFDAILQPVITLEGLEPPAGGTWGKLRQMKHSQFAGQSGWFVLSYYLPAVKPSANRVARGR